MGSLRHAPLPCRPLKPAPSYRYRPCNLRRSLRLASAPRAPRPTFSATLQAGCCVCLACTGASMDPPLLGSTGSQVGEQAPHQRRTAQVSLRRRQLAPAGWRGAVVLGLGPAAHRCPNRPSRASNPSPRPAPPDLKKEWSHQARRLLTYGFAVLEAAHCCACLLWLILRVQHFPPGAPQRDAAPQAARGHGWPPPPPPTLSGAVHCGCRLAGARPCRAAAGPPASCARCARPAPRRPPRALPQARGRCRWGRWRRAWLISGSGATSASCPPLWAWVSVLVGVGGGRSRLRAWAAAPPPACPPRPASAPQLQPHVASLLALLPCGAAAWGPFPPVTTPEALFWVLAMILASGLLLQAGAQGCGGGWVAGRLLDSPGMRPPAWGRPSPRRPGALPACGAAARLPHPPPPAPRATLLPLPALRCAPSLPSGPA